MEKSYIEIFQSTIDSLGGLFDTIEFYNDFLTIMKRGRTSISLNQKSIRKEIDVSWVKAIEDSLVSLDNVIRRPGKFIKQEEQVLPIELTKNITARSVRHLAQHTDYINSIEGDKITPSKILNVFNEESMDTYENRFINTLIDRLYIFVNKRYEKLAACEKDEEISLLNFKTSGGSEAGPSFNINLEVEIIDHNFNADSCDDSQTIFQRIERIKKIIDSYKSSDFALAMKDAYIRPPITRTNAILKNVDMRQCLVLWQIIEGYDKVGYEIYANESAGEPSDEYIDNLYALSAINYLLLRYYTTLTPDRIKEVAVRQNQKPATPKVIKRFKGELTPDYNLYDVEVRKIYNPLEVAQNKKLTDEEIAIKDAIAEAIEAEKKQKQQEMAKEKEIEKQKKLLQKQKELEKQKREIQRQREAEKRLAEKKKNDEKKKLEAEKKLAEQKKLSGQKKLEDREKLEKLKKLAQEKKLEAKLQDKENQDSNATQVDRDHIEDFVNKPDESDEYKNDLKEKSNENPIINNSENADIIESDKSDSEINVKIDGFTEESVEADNLEEQKNEDKSLQPIEITQSKRRSKLRGFFRRNKNN